MPQQPIDIENSSPAPVPNIIINQPENQGKSTSVNKFLLTIMIIAFGFGAIFFIWYISWQKTRDKSYEKGYKKEMGILNKRVDSLNKDASERTKITEKMEEDIVAMKEDRRHDQALIIAARNELLIIKKKYEKIPDYTILPLDSLHRVWSKRFGKKEN